MKDFAILESCQHSNRLFSHLSFKKKTHYLKSFFFFFFFFFFNFYKSYYVITERFHRTVKGFEEENRESISLRQFINAVILNK